MKSVEKCPFCGESPKIVVCDDDTDELIDTLDPKLKDEYDRAVDQDYLGYPICVYCEKCQASSKWTDLETTIDHWNRREPAEYRGELKTCPFCGYGPHYEPLDENRCGSMLEIYDYTDADDAYNDEYGIAIVCGYCDSAVYDNKLEMAVKKWNTRYHD